MNTHRFYRWQRLLRWKVPPLSGRILLMGPLLLLEEIRHAERKGGGWASRNYKASVDFIAGSYASQRHCREFSSVGRNNWLYWHCDEVLYVLQKWLMSRLKSRMRQIAKTGRKEFLRGRVEKAIKQRSHAQTKISPESATDGIISLYFFYFKKKNKTRNITLLCYLLVEVGVVLATRKQKIVSQNHKDKHVCQP